MTRNAYFRGKENKLSRAAGGIEAARTGPCEPWLLNRSRRWPRIRKGVGGTGGKQGFENFGEISAPKAQSRNASQTRHRNMARAGRDGTAPHGAATAERTLKWRPWGRRAGETAQQTLAGSQAAPSSRSPAQPGLPARRARAQPAPPPEPLSSLPGSPSATPHCRARGRRGAVSTEWRKAEASTSYSCPQ